LRTLLLYILPQSVIDFYKKSKKNKRLKYRALLKKENKIVTKQNIVDELQKAGIFSGEVLMLHASLSKIGFVEQGAHTVIDAFMEAVGIEGTLVMPAFPVVGFNYDYLSTNPVFNYYLTPSKMGIITEVFRNKSHVIRSLHPTDSVCAVGKHAEYLVKDHFNQLTPYNTNSPFYRLCELKAKIVLLGVDLNSLTNFHTSEDAIPNFQFPVYHPTEFRVGLEDENGFMKTMLTKVHNPEWSKKRKCNEFIFHFEKAGFLKHFTIGDANCMIIDAYQMHHWLVSNYNSKGISLYTPKGN
jgi:aminoglycoside 3-N-acetyltransferase